jgi:hypothetical protein
MASKEVSYKLLKEYKNFDNLVEEGRIIKELTKAILTSIA